MTNSSVKDIGVVSEFLIGRARQAFGRSLELLKLVRKRDPIPASLHGSFRDFGSRKTSPSLFSFDMMLSR